MRKQIEETLNEYGIFADVDDVLYCIQDIFQAYINDMESKTPYAVISIKHAKTAINVVNSLQYELLED